MVNGGQERTPAYLVRNIDACDFLRGFSPGSIACLVTDPAYESLEKHRARGTTTRLSVSKGSSNEWFSIFPNERFDEFFELAYRALAKNSHMYMFCDAETMFVAKPAGERAGFKFWKPLIWDKRKIGMGYHYRARYECVLFFEKGKRKLNDLGIPDVLEFPRIRNGYPTEKPVGVSDVLIRQSTSPGELVVDPFMGSGSVGVAALRAGRLFVGNDLSPKPLEVAEPRLREAMNAPEKAPVIELVEGLRDRVDEAVALLDSQDPIVHRVELWMCSACIDGLGGECHTPGCALFLNRAPDFSIRDSCMVETIDGNPFDCDTMKRAEASAESEVSP